jgi:hypothetical protein
MADTTSSSSSDCRVSDVASREPDTQAGRRKQHSSSSKPSSLVVSTAKTVKGEQRHWLCVCRTGCVCDTVTEENREN